jgi:hypothetical protein
MPSVRISAFTNYGPGRDMSRQNDIRSVDSAVRIYRGRREVCEVTGLAFWVTNSAYLVMDFSGDLGLGFFGRLG